MATFIIIGIIVIILTYIITIYNELIYSKHKVKQAKSNVDLFLKKRFDLIPNLESIVQNYANHEGTVLKDIASLRSNVNKNNDMDIASEEKLSNEFTKVLATVESYPELKADVQFIQFQEELSEIEDSIVSARSLYNGLVTKHNIYIEKFPTSLIASIFSVKPFNLFQINDAESQNIDIKM